MARQPTEKQMKFAGAIADKLNMELPATRTRQTLFLFIRDNVNAYRKEVRGQRRLSGRGFRAEDADAPDPIDPDEDWYQMTGEGLDPATGGFDDNY